MKLQNPEKKNHGGNNSYFPDLSTTIFRKTNAFHIHQLKQKGKGEKGKWIIPGFYD